MRIIVTGASGFIGRRVVAAMPKHVCCETIRHVDLFGRKAIDADVIINLGWPPSDYDSRMHDAMQIAGYSHAVGLFYAAARRGARFVGIGSQAEITTPNTPYAARKRDTRIALTNLCREVGMTFAWARIFSVYGPGDHHGTFISYVARELLAGRDVELTDQNVPWDYVHVEDAARAIIKIALSSGDGDYEIGSGEQIGTRLVATLLRDTINPKLSLLFGRKSSRSIEVASLKADTSHLRAIGWKPEISIMDGILSFVEYMRKK